MRIELQPAYVIHTRPYRDTSFIVEFLTPQYGRISAIAKGVRKRKGGTRALLNPFIPLLISLQGKSALKLLTHIEAGGHAQTLAGVALFSGLYVNELIVRLLPEWDAHEALYRVYCETLVRLEHSDDVEPPLRHFEVRLLQALGYSIDWYTEAISAEPIVANAYYRLEADSGFIACSPSSAANVFAGSTIIALAQGEFKTPETRRSAKQIHRILLAPLLGHKPLQARQLFLGQF